MGKARKREKGSKDQIGLHTSKVRAQALKNFSREGKFRSKSKGKESIVSVGRILISSSGIMGFFGFIECISRVFAIA